MTNPQPTNSIDERIDEILGAAINFKRASTDEAYKQLTNFYTDEKYLAKANELLDTYMSEARTQIKALIDEAENRARIDECKQVPFDEDRPKVSWRYFKDRIATLSTNSKEG